MQALGLLPRMGCPSTSKALPAQNCERIPRTRRAVRCRVADSKPATILYDASPSSAPDVVDPVHLQDYKHTIDAEKFRQLGYEVVDFIADYYQGLEGRPVKDVNLKPGYLKGSVPDLPPERPEPWEAVMADFKHKIMPGVVHWQHPRFFAYFSANSSFPGQLADMLIGALNMIGFSWAASPVSTELEMAMMDWLASLCGLPDRFTFRSGGPGGGVIQGTASEASLVALLAARARALAAGSGVQAAQLVAYGSDQAHSCFKKACMVAGIEHVRVLPGSPDHEYTLRPEVLVAALQADRAAGLTPFFVSTTIGTTSSCAVDPIQELAEVAAQFNCWVHVDAAYAGSAAVCPEFRHHFRGLDAVDSYAFNPHKWLLTNFDCCAMWFSDTAPVKDALSLTPVFLRGQGNALDYKDWQVPLGRRFRSLKLYFVLRLYGAEALREYIRHHVALAQYFADRVQSDPRFMIAAPPRFGLVCFRLRGVDNSVNKALLEALNQRGDLFMIHTELSGQHTLRFAVGSVGTQLVHVQQAWQAVVEAAEQVLAESAGSSGASGDGTN